MNTYTASQYVKHEKPNCKFIPEIHGPKWMPRFIEKWLKKFVFANHEMIWMREEFVVESKNNDEAVEIGAYILRTHKNIKSGSLKAQATAQQVECVHHVNPYIKTNSGVFLVEGGGENLMRYKDHEKFDKIWKNQ